MEVSRALQQISEIHQVLARSQTYRGYRPITIASTAVLALVASAAQAWWPTRDMVALWTTVAVCALAIVTGEMAYDYSFSLESSQKRLARKVIDQFIPGLAMGGCLTALWSCFYPALLCLLPGLWACCYSLALFSARPLLVRGVGWVALFYAVASVVLITPVGSTWGNLGMGLTFGFGQMFLAMVLFWNLPRKN